MNAHMQKVVRAAGGERDAEFAAPIRNGLFARVHHQQSATPSIFQRRCACGTHTPGGGECADCKQRRRDSAASASGPVAAQVHESGTVHRQVMREVAQPQGTNYRFDTFKITEPDLEDPDIIARLNALSKEQLEQYRDRVADPAVQAYIQNLIVSRIPVQVPCSKEDVKKTNRLAEEGRAEGVSRIAVAQKGLDRLHSAYISNKREILAGSVNLSGDPVCAFDSNFNITQRDPEYGVRQIQVMSRLRHLANRLSKAVPYECQAENDPLCGSDGSTQAFVVNQKPPIHFCFPFRDNFIWQLQVGTVIHEYGHLVPGVHDQGGYAAFSTAAMTCRPNVQFSAPSDVLTSTADALTGFIMYLGETVSIDVHVR